MDLKLAVSLAKDIIGSLEEIRRNCDSEFNKLFLEAKVSLLVYNLFILLMYCKISFFKNCNVIFIILINTLFIYLL